MQIRIRDFQVVERADLLAGGLVLVTGKNAQGKSSVLKATAAALTGQLQFGLPKKDAKALVRAGASTATAAVQGTDWTAGAAWPKCEASTSGQPPKVTPIAAGMASLLDLSAKDRAKLLADLLKTAPDRADFVSACTDASISEAIAEQVWTDIEGKGWDAKAAEIAEKGTRFKGQWEQATGQRFGTEKVQTWRPEDWTDDLADASLDDLLAEMGETRQELERAVAAAAVGQAELDRLTTACAEIDELKERSIEAQLAATKATSAYGSAQRQRDALPPAAQAKGLTCPCCKAALQLANNMGADQRLVQAEQIGDDELKKRRDAIADADGTLSRLKGERDAAERKATDAQRVYQAAQQAERQLAELKAKATAGQPGDDVEAIRARVATAEGRHRALKAKEDAERVANLLAVNLAMQAIMAPGGLRQAKLVKVLDTFNGGPLRSLCEAAGWGDVRIEPDMGVTYGGRPYEQLAGLGPQLSSDQFRVYATLQVALAQVQGCALVILDGADVLDQKGRGGLIKMLRGTGMDALIGMTFSAPDVVPDLEARGMGRAYWIDGGIARPLGEVMAEKNRKEAA
ncbi:hypothetical protein ACHMW5_02555 [Azospirillum melinis]|uniref:hypothetical protein n=1 Tax=Azospirillum melinis TaxID=328839 RepID=UPI00375661A5